MNLPDELDPGAQRQLVAQASQVLAFTTLADNGDKGKAKATVDELISHPSFGAAVLKSVDKAIGTSLRDFNKSAK